MSKQWFFIFMCESLSDIKPNNKKQFSTEAEIINFTATTYHLLQQSQHWHLIAKIVYTCCQVIMILAAYKVSIKKRIYIYINIYLHIYIYIYKNQMMTGETRDWHVQHKKSRSWPRKKIRKNSTQRVNTIQLLKHTEVVR